MLDNLRADLAHGARLAGVEQSDRCTDCDRLVDSGQPELDDLDDGDGRLNGGGLRNRSEAGLVDIDSIYTVRKSLNVELALLIRLENTAVLVRFAEDAD
jgi:hypothetical protein